MTLPIESETRTPHGRSGAGQGTAWQAEPGGAMWVGAEGGGASHVRAGGPGLERGKAARSVSARGRPSILIPAKKKTTVWDVYSETRINPLPGKPNRKHDERLKRNTHAYYKWDNGRFSFLAADLSIYALLFLCTPVMHGMSGKQLYNFCVKGILQTQGNACSPQWPKQTPFQTVVGKSL